MQRPEEDIFVFATLCFIAMRQALSLTQRLAGQHAPRIHLSDPQRWGYRPAQLCPVYNLVLLLTQLPGPIYFWCFHGCNTVWIYKWPPASSLGQFPGLKPTLVRSALEHGHQSIIKSQPTDFAH